VIGWLHGVSKGAMCSYEIATLRSQL